MSDPVMDDILTVDDVIACVQHMREDGEGDLRSVLACLREWKANQQPSAPAEPPR